MGAITTIMSTVLPVLGTAIKARGQIFAAKGEAETQRYNATIARQEAAITATKKRIETKRLRKRKEAFTSTQKALFSKAGVLFEGSPLEVIQDSQSEMEFDILVNKYNRDVERNRFLSEARFREIEAERAERFGEIQVAQTLLTGLVDVTKTGF